MRWRKRQDDLGCWGEEQAKQFLKKKGYKILAEHWTSRIGELDLVAYKPHSRSADGQMHYGAEGGSYVFIEVKTRTNEKFGAPEEAIPWWKEKKLRKTAELFLLKNKLFEVQWQIDVIAITRDLLSGEVKIKHLEHAIEG